MQNLSGHTAHYTAALLCVISTTIAALGQTAAAAQTAADQKAPTYHSPDAIALSPDGNWLYASDRTAGCLAILDLTGDAPPTSIELRGEPCGLCISPDGGTVFVAERGAGSVACVDVKRREVRDRLQVDRRPVAVALAARSGRLFVAAEDTNKIWSYNVNMMPGELLCQTHAVREPCCIAVTPDERRVIVANLLPEGVSTDPTLGAVVNILDAETLDSVALVPLPPGSTSVRGLSVSPDGKWAYVTHSLGRFTMPITQLERGWVNTSALSILEIATGKRFVTVLLDSLTMGAADPHGVVCSTDGTWLWISHAGTHEITRIKIGKLHQLLAGIVPQELAVLKDGSQPNVWVRIQTDRDQMNQLENDLTALRIAGVIHRTKSGGIGPRGLAVSSDGGHLFIANYFSGSVAVMDGANGQLLNQISLGQQPPADGRRRGEMVFHDATKAFQHWYSCTTCHPNEGRVDALSWDFLRDGIGNPKDTINLVHLDKTAPLNRRATRKTARECARTGLSHGHMIIPTEEVVDDLLEFLVALRPEPSPYLTAEGALTEAAKRGKLLFEGKADCARCHPAPYFTDQKMHDVGTHSPRDADSRYDTASLIEPYRTAPYLHDGRAHTIQDVLTTHNRHNRHGKTAGLSTQELDSLATYILSL